MQGSSRCTEAMIAERADSAACWLGCKAPKGCSQQKSKRANIALLQVAVRPLSWTQRHAAKS